MGMGSHFQSIMTPPRSPKPTTKAKQPTPELMALVRLIAAALVEQERAEVHRVK